MLFNGYITVYSKSNISEFTYLFLNLRAYIFKTHTLELLETSLYTNYLFPFKHFPGHMLVKVS